MKLIHPYESSIGGSSVGSDSRFGAGQTFKAVGGEFYYISTVGDFSHLYKISRGGTVSGPLTAGNSCDSSMLRADTSLHGIPRTPHCGTLCRRRAGDPHE